MWVKKYMECYSKTENDYLKTQTKHPMFLLIYFYFSLDLEVRLMRKEAEYNTAPLISGQDGPCRKLRLKLISPYILVAIN